MVSYDFSRVFQFLPTLWQALPMTLSILFFTTILGSLFGGLLAWAQVGEDKTFAKFSHSILLARSSIRAKTSLNSSRLFS